MAVIEMAIAPNSTKFWCGPPFLARCFIKEGLDGLISGYYPVFGITNGNADFFLYFLNYFKRKLTKYSSGTSQLVLSIKSLKTAKFNFPTHQEQSKIAEILNAANKELQQYQQKLNNLKTQKKGLMQQLLTGKVRTV